MRPLLIVAGFAGFALFSGAQAEPMQHSCIVVGDGYQRVDADVSRPENCCSGRMQCAQFLSTTRVVRPGHGQHT